jgi:hypothetical protein
MQPVDHQIWNTLLELVRRGNSEAITEALAGLMAKDVLRWTEPDPGEGRTLLMLAYWFGQAATAEVLLTAGADYHQVDTRGNHAAWFAGHFGQGLVEERISAFIGASDRRIAMKGVLDAVPGGLSEEVGGEDGATAPPSRRTSL